MTCTSSGLGLSSSTSLALDFDAARDVVAAEEAFELEEDIAFGFFLLCFFVRLPPFSDALYDS